MSAFSLDGALRTCKVDTAYANKVQSDRFLAPQNMVCPVWTGVDSTGRTVCPDSFYTKSAGCNSAEDRIVVENNQRPQYFEYINLSASGVDGLIYGEDLKNNMNFNEVGTTNKNLRNINNITGQFGTQFSAEVYPSCAYYPYSQAMNQMTDQKQGTVEGFARRAEDNRTLQALSQGYNSNRMRVQAGF